MKDQLDELVTSIKSYGVLEPIIVAQTPAGYQIIAGERRWRAAQVAGLSEVPVLVKVTTPRGMLEMAIIENVQRVDLNPLERAQAFQQLIRDFKFQVQQIAEQIGKSMPYVSNTLRLLELPDALKDGLAGGQITEGHARALLAVADEKSRVELYKKVLKGNLSVRATEEMVRQLRNALGLRPEDKTMRTVMRTANVVQWEINFSRFFEAKSRVKLSRSQRQTKITIVLHGTEMQTQKELDRLMALTEKKTAEV